MTYLGKIWLAILILYLLFLLTILLIVPAFNYNQR